MPRKSWILVTAFVFVVACATRQPGDPLKPGYNTFSKEQDIELGREAAAEVRQQVDVVKDQKLQNYVKVVGVRLARQPQAEDYPYEFTLINEESINAFALPGGPVFIHSGLLAAADTEAQFAGVLAHEISHVALRHGTSQASKAQMVQLPAVLAGAILGDGGALSQIGQVGLGLGLNALIMKYSRTAEKEADALGARIMSEAGYDPLAMAEFFQKLEEETGGSQPPAFLSSHPSPGNRVQLVRAEMQTFPPGQYGYETGDFPLAKKLVAQLPKPNPPDQKQVANAGASPPSGLANQGSFQRVNARTFSLEMPPGWQTYGGQGSNVLTIAPQQGLVQTGRGGVALGYGAVTSNFQPRYSRDLLNGAYELIDELQEMDSTLRVTREPRQTKVQGASALVTELQGRSPYGGVERDVLLTVARPNGIYYLLLVGPQEQFGQLEPAFNRMIQSVQFR
ncbi:MAG: M48 family metalloprotease [Acidobacteria bacterium]|nr:M48 family metalloprotease [Acidobacteriota bacterium]